MGRGPIAGAFSPATAPDGDLDIWLDNGSANRRAHLLINDGQGRFTDETNARINKTLNRLYLGTPRAKIDRQAPQFRAIEGSPKEVSPGRYALAFAVVDGSVSDTNANLSRAFAVMVDGSSQEAQFIGGDLYQVTLTGPDATREIRQLCAVDRHEKQTCILP